MSIHCAILGILASKPQTGYDLKKIIQDSPFLPWSGNNNQIYKVLLELLDEGYVTNEVRHQEAAPSKKIYTITNEGMEELKKWIMSEPELPEFRKMFLVQLAWSELLSDEEIGLLLSNYENTIKVQLMLHRKNGLNESFCIPRSAREKAVFDAIYENIASSYENELSWVQKTQFALSDGHTVKIIHTDDKCKTPFKPYEFEYSIVEKGGQRYIEFSFIGDTISSEQSALDIIALCAENDTNLIIVQGELLNGDFRKLSTGLAGKILQKFATYRIEVAVITGELKVVGKFRDMMHKCNNFKLFDSIDKAENWILNIKGNEEN